MIRLSLFDEDQLKAIHEATLRVLNETGVILTHPEGRNSFRQQGQSYSKGASCCRPD